MTHGRMIELGFGYHGYNEDTFAAIVTIATKQPWKYLVATNGDMKMYPQIADPRLIFFKNIEIAKIFGCELKAQTWKCQKPPDA